MNETSFNILNSAIGIPVSLTTSSIIDEPNQINYGKILTAENIDATNKTDIDQAKEDIEDLYSLVTGSVTGYVTEQELTTALQPINTKLTNISYSSPNTVITGNLNVGSINSYSIGNLASLPTIPVIDTAGGLEISRYIDMHIVGDTIDYNKRFFLDGATNQLTLSNGSGINPSTTFQVNGNANTTGNHSCANLKCNSSTFNFLDNANNTILSKTSTNELTFNSTYVTNLKNTDVGQNIGTKEIFKKIISWNDLSSGQAIIDTQPLYFIIHRLDVYDITSIKRYIGTLKIYRGPGTYSSELDINLNIDWYSVTGRPYNMSMNYIVNGTTIAVNEIPLEDNQNHFPRFCVIKNDVSNELYLAIRFNYLAGVCYARWEGECVVNNPKSPFTFYYSLTGGYTFQYYYEDDNIVRLQHLSTNLGYYPTNTYDERRNLTYNNIFKPSYYTNENHLLNHIVHSTLQGIIKPNLMDNARCGYTCGKNLYVNTVNKSYFEFSYVNDETNGKYGFIGFNSNDNRLKLHYDTNKVEIVNDLHINGNVTGNCIETIQMDIQNRATGIVTMPTITDNLDGSLSVGTNGVVIFSSNPSGDNHFKRIEVTNNATLSPPDQTQSYLYCFYNDDNPIYGILTNPVTFYFDARYPPIARIQRDGNDLYIIEYGNYAVSGTNKTIIKDVFLNGIQRLSGLLLTTEINRIVTLSSGAIFLGVNLKSLAENKSGVTGLLKEYYLVNSVWNNSTVTNYDNSYYSDGINRIVLGVGKYVSKYFYRSVSNINVMFYVHGNQYNDINDCINETNQLAPSFIIQSAIYVGKIVIQKSATNGVAYQVDWSTGNVGTVSVTSHNNLANLQGGTTNEYYHLSNQQYTNLTAYLENGINTLTTLTTYVDTINFNTNNALLYYTEPDDTTKKITLKINGFDLFNISNEKTSVDPNPETFINNTNINANTTVNGNLTVNGTIIDNMTITHTTQFDNELFEDIAELGTFIISTPNVYKFANTTKSPYEDCITKIMPYKSLTNISAVIGVLTNIDKINHTCRFATHGDILIKVIADKYNIGDILVPTINGYAKKGTQQEIMNCLINKVNTVKIISLNSSIPDTVVAFL